MRSSEKFRRTITKGIRLATAIFLLEATVLLASGAQWTGSWTQRLYGTGSADVWEVLGDHGRVSDVSWRQGWRVLEPLRQAHFGDEKFQETLNVTLLEREPGLLVMECPVKHWRSCMSASLKQNAAKQKSKRIRESLRPFLETASRLADVQLQCGRDFVLEIPLDNSVLHDAIIKDMMKDYRVNVSRCDMCAEGLRSGGEYIKRPTWWLTSCTEISDALDVRCTQSHGHGSFKHEMYATLPNKTATKIMLGYAKMIKWKNI